MSNFKVFFLGNAEFKMKLINVVKRTFTRTLNIIQQKSIIYLSHSTKSNTFKQAYVHSSLVCILQRWFTLSNTEFVPVWSRRTRFRPLAT